MRLTGVVDSGLLSALFLALTASALDAEGWSTQSIYQVVVDRFARTDGSTTAYCNPLDQDYCGGSWQGLINKLDYIQGMGFTAVWISPVVKQLEGHSNDGSAYHGYWAEDIWSVNPHFGTEDDLIALSNAVHTRGMYLMVDVVTNHMGYLGCGDCVDYTVFNSFNDASYYHPFCLIDYTDEYASTIQTCWQGSNTVSLPDLRTELASVRATWATWIQDLVAKFSIDGLRIDSAKHIEKEFHTLFEDAARVYTLGEVLHGDPAYTLPYQEYMSGVANYPLYFWIKRAFGSDPGDFTELSEGIMTVRSSAVNSSLLGSFMENHDQERFPHVTTDMALTKNAIAFMMLMDGIPIIYQGQEQGYGGDVQEGRNAIWLSGFGTATDLYVWISKLNALRKAIVANGGAWTGAQAYPILTQDWTIVMKKGQTWNQVISVYSSLGTTAGEYLISLDSAATGFSAGEELVEVMACNAQTVGTDGTLVVTVQNGMPKVFYPRAKLQGSGICPAFTGGETSTTTTTPTSTSTTATSCTATNVAVTFNEQATTSYGNTIKIVGSIPALGSWDTGSALSLDASEYTSSYPLWTITLDLPVDTEIQYKFINVASSGSVTWEVDPNHTLSLSGCDAATTVAGSWQG